MEIKAYWQVLKDRWRIVIPIFLVTLVAALIFTLNQPRIYEARATYIMNLSASFDNREFASVLDTLSRRIELSTTFAEVASSRRIRTMAAQELGLSPEVRSQLSVDGRLIPGTNMIAIAVQGTDPELVKNYTDAIGAIVVAYTRDLYEIYELVLLDEAVTPNRPIQPKTALNLILGGLLGLVLGVVMAYLSYFFQTSEEHSRGLASAGNGTESFNEHYLPIMQLRQDLIALQAQFDATRHLLEQTQIALRRTQYDAESASTTVRNLEAQLEENHTEGGKNDQRKDFT